MLCPPVGSGVRIGPEGPKSPGFGVSVVHRLVVVADNSLIVEAIVIGLRQSGEFKLLGHVEARAVSWRAIVEADPEVVLIDDTEPTSQNLDLITRLKAERPKIAVIVLAMDMDEHRLSDLFAAGADGAIAKSTHPAALATLVRESVNGHVIHGRTRPDQLRRDANGGGGADESALTTRELEVLRLVAGGSTNGEIARKLWVTEQTVKFHLSNVYRKLEVGNRTEASHFAHANGLIGAAVPLAAS
jgi:DNA-binding NarL/FixJ family response regulator